MDTPTSLTSFARVVDYVERYVGVHDQADNISR
jgi:hypothetical protein